MHLITAVDSITNPSSFDQDPFAYNITTWYTSNKFLGIIINTGASKRSMAGYRQFLAF